MDFDLRGGIGDAPSTPRPRATPPPSGPSRTRAGIISYPGYQVAVARRGDTVSAMAARIGTDAGWLADATTGWSPRPLRDGEIVALPDRVAEPEGGPITPPAASTSPRWPATPSTRPRQARTSNQRSTRPGRISRGRVRGTEPVRHKVERGETAYSIARLYDVSVRSLGEWNGLGSDFTVREGQYLLIPVALPDEPRSALGEARRTGRPRAQGSATPEPPSAATPAARRDATGAAAETGETTAAPDLSQPETEAPAPRACACPVRGDIIRDYDPGHATTASTSPPHRARRSGGAAAGTVARSPEDTNGVPIIVVSHPTTC